MHAAQTVHSCVSCGLSISSIRQLGQSSCGSMAQIPHALLDFLLSVDIDDGGELLRSEDYVKAAAAHLTVGRLCIHCDCCIHAVPRIFDRLLQTLLQAGLTSQAWSLPICSST
jgi:hypothetical protein